MGGEWPWAGVVGDRLGQLEAVKPSSAGPAQFLDWHGRSTHLTSDEVLGLLAVRQRTDRPLIVVLDNASFHHALDVQDAIPERWKRGVYLYYLPPYSPERNRIERLFRTIKHYDLPERTYPTLDQLTAAVEAAFARQEAKLPPPATPPRLAA